MILERRCLARGWFLVAVVRRATTDPVYLNGDPAAPQSVAGVGSCYRLTILYKASSCSISTHPRTRLNAIPRRVSARMHQYVPSSVGGLHVCRRSSHESKLNYHKNLSLRWPCGRQSNEPNYSLPLSTRVFQLVFLDFIVVRSMVRLVP